MFLPFAGGTVYFAGENTLCGEISRLARSSGNSKIQQENHWVSNPAVKDGTVYVGGEDQRLYAIDTQEWI